MIPRKADVIAALRQSVAEELAAMERVAAMSRDEVSSDETRSEGKYDTRATEASYLARGLAVRILELRQLSAWFESFNPEQRCVAACVGALVELEGGELLLLAPVGGGKVSVGGRAVSLVSPASPLGEALLELEAGDSVEIETPRGARSREVLRVW